MFKSDKEGINSSLIKREMELLIEYIDNSLDTGYGKCHLSDERIAKIVADALKFFDGDRYKLLAWCIMPNHVHVIVQIPDRERLSSILHSWKAFTAREANKVLGSNGSFWQREYYDHLIRDEDELIRTIIYIVENPLKARLKDWKWVWTNFGNADF